MKSKQILISELTECIQNLEINNADTLYTTGNVSRLARSRLKKDDILDALLSSFKISIGDKGTLFAPSASMNLCNTNTVFDIENTPSHEMGAFSEYLRQSKNKRKFYQIPFLVLIFSQAKDIIMKKINIYLKIKILVILLINFIKINSLKFFYRIIEKVFFSKFNDYIYKIILKFNPENQDIVQIVEKKLYPDFYPKHYPYKKISGIENRND